MKFIKPQLINKIISSLKENDVVIKLFKEYDLDLDELYYIPICFDDDLTVSARTDHGIIYINSELLQKETEIPHYLVHEITHFAQQTTGTKPTKGSADDSYLDNKYEQEGFKAQTEYLSDTRSDETAEKYVEKVLNHHDVPEEERDERRNDLLQLAADRFENMIKLAFKCSQPGCEIDYDEKKYFMTVLDGNPPGLYCTWHATYCKTCRHPVAKNNAGHIGSDQVTVQCKKCYHAENNVCQKCGKLSSSGLFEENNQRVCAECQDPCVSCERILEGKIDPEGDKLCEFCYDKIWTTCPHCDTVVKQNDLKEQHFRWERNRKKEVGCDECMDTCESCSYTNFNDADGLIQAPDGKIYCQDCYSEYFATCDECNDEVDRENIVYIESNESNICSNCYATNYGTCYGCKQDFPQNNLTEGPDGEYCEDCLEAETSLPKEYESLNLAEGVSFTKYDKYLTELQSKLPISVRELKNAHPKLAAALKDLIVFAGGKDITEETIKEFRSKYNKDYQVAYTAWRSKQQRSVKSLDVPQLVLNIVAGEDMLQEMHEDGSYVLFEKINQTSKESGHPMVEDQIGWARLELDPEGKYLLVDEIQTDHMNAIDRINKEHHMGEEYKTHIMRSMKIDEEKWNQICNSLKNHIREFPDVVLKAISEFAKQNGFKKTYYHTFESGRKLKNNYPPRSLYTDVPKRNMFMPTPERPFGLEGNFLAREARRNKFLELMKNSRLNKLKQIIKSDK